MDGQRQYPGDPDRWYGEDDDLGRVPGQRSAERFVEPPDAGRGYGDHFPDQPYGGHEAPDYLGESEPATYPPSDRPVRRRNARPARIGRRSGLELPDAEPGTDYQPVGDYESAAEFESADEPPRYRAERLDRQALRREGQTYQSAGTTYDQGAGTSYDQGAGTSYDQGAGTSYDQGAGTSYDQGEQQTADRAADRTSLSDHPQTYPTVPPSYVSTQPAAPTQMTPAVPAMPTAVYLAKRPAIGALIVAVAVVIELLVVRVLFAGEFGHTVNPGGVIGGVFAMAGVPLVGLGLYGLARGAATAGGPEVMRTWLRPPLAYLPIGLLLLIVAGLAA